MINESITGNGVSASTVAAGTTSDVIIEATGPGQIFLQAQAPGSANWVNVTNQTGAFAVATPDPAVLYQFKAVGLIDSVLVYFGA